MSNIGQHIRDMWRRNIPNAFPDEPTISDKETLDIDAINNIIEYNKKIIEPVKIREYTAEEVFGILSQIKWFSTELYDINNHNIVKLLCLYFTKDKRFEQYKSYPDFSLNKGIALFGNTGVGKTRLMEIFQKNMNFCYIMKPTSEIADEFSDREKGRQIISSYSSNRNIIPSSSNFGQQKMGICFDDFGDEPVTAHFGDSDRIMIPIMEGRYRLGDFNSTHITTNITVDQIETYYGKRVRSRMREMFNVIDFRSDSKDLRR